MTEKSEELLDPVAFIEAAIFEERRTNPYCPMAAFMTETLNRYQQTRSQKDLDFALEMARETLAPKKAGTNVLTPVLRKLGFIH